MGNSANANTQSSSIYMATPKAEAKMTAILGIDPGIRGGLAIVSVDANDIPCLVDAIDIPVTGVGAKERVDVLAEATPLLRRRHLRDAPSA
jgi:hypothetical protein